MSEWRIISRETRDKLGEGTLWSARHDALFWVDILAPAVNRLSLETGAVTRWDMPEPVGWIVERVKGDFIVGLQSGFAALSLDPFSVQPIVDPEPHLPGSRMNDGKADSTGHIWCGTMDMGEESDCGALYRLSPDFTWARMDEGYLVPNGPAFSTDGRWLYHTDSARQIIYRFERHDDGSLGPKTRYIEFTPQDGHPDGMTVDAENCLWVAHWGGARISRFDPNGKRMQEIALPATQITNMAFAGEKLDRLFVTTATVGLDASPADGALFEVEVDVRGVAPGLFAG